MNTSDTVTVRPTAVQDEYQVMINHIVFVPTKEEMFIFVQGPHIIGQSTAITAINLTTPWMKLFVNTTQSE